MINEKPLISICIAVYNLEIYIKQCLESILSQEFKDYEILLYDNGSSDRSIEICEEYAKKYSSHIRFTALDKPTIIGRPWRMGVKEMKGHYFMVVDGDDYITEGSLQRIADIIMSNNCDIIMGTFICDTELGMPNFKDAFFKEQRINNVSYEKAIEYLATLPNFHSVQWRYILSNKILSKEFRNKKQNENDDISLFGRYNDTLHVCMIFNSANSIFFMKEPFYVYRKRGGSLTGKIRKNENIVVDFMKFVLTLIKFKEDTDITDINPYEKHQMDVKFNLFRLACNLNTYEENFELAKLINANYKYYELALKYDIHGYRELYNIVKSKGTLEGIVEHQKKQIINCLMALGNINNKRIYVFPTGLCGEATAELLKCENIKIDGFLDNDTKKEGMEINKIICSLPQKVSEFDSNTKKNIIVIVATAYLELRGVLKNQLLGYGISNSNIIVR